MVGVKGLGLGRVEVRRVVAVEALHGSAQGCLGKVEPRKSKRERGGRCVFAVEKLDARRGGGGGWVAVDEPRRVYALTLSLRHLSP